MRPSLGVLILVIVLGMLGLPVHGQPPWPVMKPPIVRPKVTFDPKTGLFTYRYTITNVSASTARIFFFHVDIARRDRQPVTRVDAFTNPGVGDTNPYIMDRIQHLVIPVAVRDAPEEWTGGVGYAQLVGFVSSANPIKPGETKGPFVLVSKGLVGARHFNVEERIDSRKLPDFTKATSDEEYHRIRMENAAIKDAAAFTGPTIGPSSLPVEVTTPAAMVEFLRQQKDQAAKLGWIGRLKPQEREQEDDRHPGKRKDVLERNDRDDEERGKGVIRSLNTKLAAVKLHIERGKFKTAANILHAFIHELEAQRGKHLNENAFFLLKPNAEFILSKLPRKEKADEDRDDDHRHRPKRR